MHCCLPLMTALDAVSRSTTGLPAPGAGAMSSGLNIFTRPWLLPHASDDTMIEAWTRAPSSSQPTAFKAAVVFSRASAWLTRTTSSCSSSFLFL